MATRRRFLLSSAGAFLVGGIGTGVASAAAPSRLAIPFVSQFDGSTYAATNCGPSSLAMVLRYFSRSSSEKVTPDALRRSLIKLPGGGYAADPNQGTAIQDLAALARARGVQPVMGPARGSTGWTPERIADQLAQGRPAIILTRLNALPGWGAAPDGYDHWIVLTGAVGDRYIYNDPALSGSAGANRVLSREALVRAMALSTVPTQGAVFAGPDSPASYPKLPANLPPEDRSSARVVVALVRLGNGSLGARPPLRLGFDPSARPRPGTGSLWDAAALGRTAPI